MILWVTYLRGLAEIEECRLVLDDGNDAVVGASRDMRDDGSFDLVGN